MQAQPNQTEQAQPLSPGQQTPPGLRQHHVTCSLDCPDSCRVIATEDTTTGKLVRLAGDPAHPVTRGFLCGKVARYLDRVYDPGRLLYPMRRRAGVPKGPLPHGREPDFFEPVSWNEALDTVAHRLQQISDEHGPESILPYSYAGTIGQLGYGSMDRRFFHRLGASQLDRTICAAAGGAALTDVYGVRLGMEPQSFAKSRLIVAWGANIHGNNIHLWPFIEEARRNGAKLIVIDPYQTRTAKLADQHLAVRPGTDVLLAMGLMRVIVRENLQNSTYIEQCTKGFKDLRERVMDAQYAPDNVARITGIAAETVMALARAYATTPAAAIRVNYGVQRSESGGTAVRAIAMLPLLTGAWQHPGGGLLLSTSGAFQFNQAALQMPELMQASPLGRTARTVNMSRLGHALTVPGSRLLSPVGSPRTSSLGPPLQAGMAGEAPTAADGPPVHALFVYNSNPAVIAPNQKAVLQGLQRADLFTVVHDVNFTDTADYADILLPAPTWLEQTDLQGAYGHHFVQLSPAAIAPLGEAKPNVWLFAQLAQRMGFPESCFHDTEADLIRQAMFHVEHSWLREITPEILTNSLDQSLYVKSLLSEHEEARSTALPAPEKQESTAAPALRNRQSTEERKGTASAVPKNMSSERASAPEVSSSGLSSTSSPKHGGRGFLPLRLPRTPSGDYLPFSTPDWFRTPSGRGEFTSSVRAAAGLDPLPAYIPGEEGVEAESQNFPLQMLPRKADHWMNSTFASLPRHRSMQAGTLDAVEIHPSDAAARGIEDGGTVEVSSARGSVRLIARLSQRVAPGVCAATLGWNKLAAGGHGINVLTSERMTDIGAGPTYYSTRVEIVRITHDPVNSPGANTAVGATASTTQLPAAD